MYMPLMVDIKRCVVFAAERGEGLQKLQKMALFADELLAVFEGPVTVSEVVIPAGKPSELNENLKLPAERRVPVHALPAHEADLEALISGATFVTSDLADAELNRRISDLAARQGVLCNIIDTKPLCNTWFMSLIETDHLLAAFSSKGQAAFYAARLRRQLEPRFTRWEIEAAFTVEAKKHIPRGQSLEGLTAIWGDAPTRALLRWLGPKPALRRAQTVLKKHFALKGPA